VNSECPNEEGFNAISFVCYKMPPTHFLIHILKLKLKFQIQIVDPNNFYDRCMLLRFYDFWTSFDTKSNENKMNILKLINHN
jgi:hypothetical protein